METASIQLLFSNLEFTRKLKKVYHHYVKSVNTFQFDFNATEFDELHVDQVRAQLKDAQESWEKYQAKDKEGQQRCTLELITLLRSNLLKMGLFLITGLMNFHVKTEA